MLDNVKLSLFKENILVYFPEKYGFRGFVINSDVVLGLQVKPNQLLLHFDHSVLGRMYCQIF